MKDNINRRFSKLTKWDEELNLVNYRVNGQISQIHQFLWWESVLASTTESREDFDYHKYMVPNYVNMIIPLKKYK